MADCLGCSVNELRNVLHPEEFEMRLVYHMNKLGYTYDQQKKAEIKHQAAIQERNEFLASCPWNN